MKPRVLVVDDSPELRRLVATVLRRADMDVIEAASGGQGLDAARNGIDLAIVDVELPDISGLEVCRRLKGDPATSSIGVLMLSGAHRDVEDRIRGLDVGADGYLTKPAPAVELVATVQSLLRRRADPSAARAGAPPAAEALLEIGTLLSRSIDPEVVASRVAESVQDTLGVQAALVLETVPEPADVTVLGSAGSLAPTVREALLSSAGRALVGLVARAREPFATPNLLTDGRLRVTPELGDRLADTCSRAVLAVPMVVRDEVVGVLAVGDAENRTFSDADVRHARAFADLGAVAIEGARLYKETLRQRREAEALAQVSRLFAESLDPAEVAQRIVDSVRPLFGAAFSRLRLVEADGSLRVVASSGRPLEPVEAERVLPPGVGIAGRTVTTGRAVATPDALSDHAVHLDPPLRALIGARADRAVLGVPLRTQRGIVGALTLGDRTGRRFSEAETTLLQAFADQAALAFDNARAYADAARGRTEAEAAIAELRLSEARLALAQRIGHVGSWQLDLSTGVMTWSEETHRIFGRDAGAPLRSLDALYEAVHPGDRERVRRAGAESFAAGTPLRIEHRIVRPDGTERIVLAQAEIEKNADGRAVRAVGTVQDVTQQRVAQQQLAAQYEVARVLAESADVGAAIPAILRAIGEHLRWDVAEFWRVDPAARVLRRAGAWQAEDARLDAFVAETSGLAIRPGECLLGRAWHEAQPIWLADVGTDHTSHRTAAAVRLGLHGALAFPVGVGDDTVGVVSALTRQIRESDGESLAMIRVLAHQIGESLERERAEAALRASEALKSAIVETALDAVVTVDHAGRILEFNGAAERAFRWRRGEAIGSPLVDLLFPPHLRAGAHQAVQRLAEALRADSVAPRVELTARRADESEIPIELAVTRIPLDGPPLFTLHVRDLTETKRLESQFLQAQKMEAVGRLAGGVAHDFNNLLTVIMGRAYVLLSRLSREDPIWRQIDLIRSTSERAAGLTHQLLAFSRKQVLQPRVLEVNAVLGGMESMLRRLIGEDVELRLVKDAGTGRVRADLTQIEQVILNLAVNARDAMPDGGRLTIAAANAELDGAFVASHPGAREGPYVAITVTDTGHGMSQEVLSHLFEPFFTTKEPGRGTGLGLATVYGIVKQHDGYIAVESAPGEGARFGVYLPRVPEEAAAGPEAAVPKVAHGSETVLVVEDEPGLRDLVREILQVHGYAVLEAANPGEALLICERHAGTIHLLLTDVVMPLMGGRELAERLVKLRPDLLVVYMSGYPQDAIANRGVLEPGIRLLQKPFSPAALVHTVREVLDTPR